MDTNVFITEHNEFIIDSIINSIKKRVDIELFKPFVGQNYNLIITGSVGVGKSTISELIHKILNDTLNIKTYPEYINYKFGNLLPGLTLFDMMMMNKITPFTFQSFVFDIWNTLFEENNFKHCNTFNMFERLPFDALDCFVIKNDNLTPVEKSVLNKRYQKFKIKHNFIEYTDCKKISVYNYDLIECVIEILDIIKQDLIQGVKNRAICLKVDESDYVKRMVSRGRISEQGYKNSTLKTFNDYYNNNFN